MLWSEIEHMIDFPATSRHSVNLNYDHKSVLFPVTANKILLAWGVGISILVLEFIQLAFSFTNLRLASLPREFGQLSKGLTRVPTKLYVH